MRRTNPSPEVTARLWGRAAGRCEFPGCAKDLTRDSLTKRGGNYADRAHVYAFRRKGPRGRSWSSAKAANRIENLMLLCLKHHRLIDRNPAEFPADRLLAFKAEHESRVSRATNFSISLPSYVLQVRAAIAAARVATLTREDIWQDLTAAGHFPATDAPLVIDMAELGYTDMDREFWQTCEATLTRKLETAFAEHGSLHKAAHVSVFALAPMAVLMLLGKILGDARPAAIYQYDRFAGGWAWAEPECEDVRSYSYTISAPKDARHVALVINLSAAIDPDLIRAAMQAHGDFATATFTTPQPKYSLIRNPKDLRAFHELMRECLNTIERTFGSECIVHVFPAMPASTAVQFGRLLLPKASPSLQIYDHHGDRAGFAPTLWLVRRTPRLPLNKSTALARTA
jgi:hypothetical protein